MASVCRARMRFEKAGLEPQRLEAKEGLALLNGTQAMHAVGGLALLRAKRLSRVADVAGAMSLEASKARRRFRCAHSQTPARIPASRRSREHLLSLLREAKSGNRISQDDPRVQDAYSLRCMPQVHGAVRGALAHCEEVSRSNRARRRIIRSSLPRPATSFPAAIFTARRSPLRSITRRSR